MVSQEDIAAQQELLVAYRRTLAQLLKQQALISELYTPPAITHGIDEARENIQRLKAILRSWDVLVEDLPDDAAPVAKRPIAAAPHATPRRPIARWLKLLSVALALLVFGSTLAFVLLIRKPAPVGSLSGVLSWTQCGSPPTVVLPSEIAPAQDPARAAQQLAQAITTKQISSWKAAGPDVEALYMDEPGHARGLYAALYGKGEGRVIIRFMSKVQLAIAAQDAPQHVDIAIVRSLDFLNAPSGCGRYRDFPSIDLQRDATQYIVDRAYDQHDQEPFFGLNSESFETLHFSFECRSPGTYTIQLSLPYQDIANSTSATFLSSDVPGVVCPDSFTFWPVTYKPIAGSDIPQVQFGIAKNYFWDGTRYQGSS